LISTIVSPLLIIQIQALWLPLPLPIRVSSGFLVMELFGNGLNQLLPCFFKIRRKLRLTPSSCLLFIFPFSREIKEKLPNNRFNVLFSLKDLLLREKLFFHFVFLGKRSII
jgi:hypothetical protein